MLFVLVAAGGVYTTYAVVIPVQQEFRGDRVPLRDLNRLAEEACLTLPRDAELLEAYGRPLSLSVFCARIRMPRQEALRLVIQPTITWDGPIEDGMRYSGEPQYLTDDLRLPLMRKSITRSGQPTGRADRYLKIVVDLSSDEATIVYISYANI